VIPHPTIFWVQPAFTRGLLLPIQPCVTQSSQFDRPYRVVHKYLIGYVVNFHLNESVNLLPAWNWSAWIRNNSSGGLIPVLTGLGSNMPVKTMEWSRITDYWAAHYIHMVLFSLFKNCQWFEESHLFSIETFVMDLPKLRYPWKNTLFGITFESKLSIFYIFWGEGAEEPSSLLRFLYHTHTHTQTHSVWLLQTKDHLVAYQHIKHKRRISMHSTRFEPSIPAIEKPQTYALHRTAAGIGHFSKYFPQNYSFHLLKFVICHLFSKYFSMLFYVIRCPFIVSKSNLWVV
jgi:hypothetical protein